MRRRAVISSLWGLVASGCLLDFDGLTGGVAPSGAAGSAGSAVAGASGAIGGAGSAGVGASGGASGTGGGSAGVAGIGGISGAGSGGASGSGGVGKAGGSGAGASGASAGVGGASGGASGIGGVSGASGGGAAGGGGVMAGAAGSAGSSGCGTSNDPKNCGACGRDCLGGTCAAGECAPAVAWSAAGTDGGAGVVAIALDAARVYWSTDTRLYRQPLDGGTVVDLGAVDGARSMVAASGRLFLATKTQLVACDLPDCSTRGPIASGEPVGVAVDATSVFWTDRGTSPNYTDGTILRCGLFGCASPTLLTTSKNEWNPAGISVGGGFVHFAMRAEPTTGSGFVRRIPSTGSGVSMSDELAGPMTGPLAVAWHAGRVYWTETGGQPTVRHCDPSACTPSLVVPDGVSPYPTVNSRALVVDAGGVLWTNDASSASGSTVLSCVLPACGGAPKLVKSGLVSPGSLAANGARVFFGDATKAGTLWRWVR